MSFFDLIGRAFSTFSTLANNSDVRREVVGKTLDAVQNQSVGEGAVSAVKLGTGLVGRNANDIPEVATSLIRGGGDAANFLISNLPGAGALNAGVKTAAELAAGRELTHLKDLAVETASAFAPAGVSEAIGLYGSLLDLPAVRNLAKKESAPASARAAPAPASAPAPSPEMPSPLPRVPPSLPRIPEPAEPAPAMARSERIQRLSSQFNPQPFTPPQLQTQPQPQTYKKLAKKRKARKA